MQQNGEPAGRIQILSGSGGEYGNHYLHAGNAPLFETLVKLAILTVLNDGQGFYRCERDLHHHFTVCLDRIQPLHLGSREPVLHTERPAIACYGSGRHGNIDFFVADESHCAGSQSGVAVEVNWNYNDPLGSTGSV